MNDVTTESDWQREAQRNPATLVRRETPSLWSNKVFVVIVALTLVCAVGVLKSVYDLHQLVFVSPAYAEFGSNADRGYGASGGGQVGRGGGNWEPMRGSGRHHSYAPQSHWGALADIFRSMVGIEDRPRASVRRLSPSEQHERDRSVDRTSRNGNRGGAYD